MMIKVPGPSFYSLDLYLKSLIQNLCLFLESFGYLDERIDSLTQKCVEELKSQGFEE